jgi:hypothetical protein
MEPHEERERGRTRARNEAAGAAPAAAPVAPAAPAAPDPEIAAAPKMALDEFAAAVRLQNWQRELLAARAPQPTTRTADEWRAALDLFLAERI